MLQKNKSIFQKLLSHYIIIILIIMIIIFSVSYKIIKSVYIDSVVKELQNNLLLINDIVLKDVVKSNSDAINSSIAKVSEKLDLRVTIVDLNGKVIADSHEDYKSMENHGSRPEILDAIKLGAGKSIRFSNTLKINMLYVAVPLKYNGNTLAVSRGSIKLKDINEIIYGLRFKAFLFLLLILFVAVCLAFFMSKSFTSPIVLLTEASKNVAEGNFNYRIFSKKVNSREIALLEENFNNMTINLESFFHEINSEREELRSIISSVNESIIILDSDGRILLANESFYNLIAKSDIKKKYYWEVLNNSALIKFINKLNEKEKNITKEIEYKSKWLLCSINFISANRGYVVILHDISELKNLEAIKKDMIANVSHELRTPLTAIKGYVETILEEEQDNNKVKYLGIIKRHTERLENIIKDLLVLSQLERFNPDAAHFESVNIYELVTNVVLIFEEKIKAKNLSIKFEKSNQKKLKVECDPFKLEQVFINLIDNAIKYSDDGVIKIAIYDEVSNVKIDIVDNGIGIPKKDISRIFERFYVVDKSRSKKSGGTGLGLSIVKHVLLMHKGKIDVSSIEKKGTIFSITIPKKR